MVKQKIALFLATVGGAGYFPGVPGTFTSALTAVFFYFFLSTLSLPVVCLFLMCLFSLGVWSSDVAGRHCNQKDPSCIVIDEVVGMGVALLFVPPIGWMYVTAFVLFRILDIMKPYPINRLEALPGGWGIIMDDVTAGIVTRVLMGILVHLVF